jgi:UDP-glucose 4-epimerase
MRCARRGSATSRPVERWDWGLWAWVSSEDLARAHRLVLEKAGELPVHDVFFCNASDTFALEPSREIVEKHRPDLLPLIKEPLEGHAAFISNRKLREAVGWEHEKGWREHLK